MSPRSSRFVLAVALVCALAAIGLKPVAAEAQTIKHNCSFCHNLHGGSYAALSDYEIQEDLCWSCHDNAILGDTQVLRDGISVTVPQNGYEVHDGAKHTAFSRAPTGCWDCHNHEGEADGLQGYNLSMIQARVLPPAVGSDTMDVIFKSRGTDATEPTLYSFADGDEDEDSAYTGVCEVCHTETSNHQNGTAPDPSSHAHEVGRTCSDCHTHDAGFAGGGPCASCHDTGGQGTTGSNSRRAIIPELSRVSHHVGSGYEDADCQVCHDMSAHQAGTVKLKNADDPGTVYSLSGDPNTSSTAAATLSAFCLSCHDADGAGGSVPFSDLVTPPVIDATAWTASSHEGSVDIAGCYGNGTFGCHASGHGSEKLNLLAPADVAPNATTLYEEEEGFCFNCHDSDGPASSDLAIVFAEPINWTGITTGGNAVTTFNDRHDVQHAAQTVSGALIECTSCHDPHADAAAQPYRTDPDPTDGHVPGTDWYMAGYQAAGDVLSEFCLDCHDGSLPAGTADHTGAGMVDIEDVWLTIDGMGQVDATGNAGLLTGIGWGDADVMPCSACHLPHPNVDQDFGITSQFAIVDTLRSKDGTTYLQSFYDRKGASTFEYGIVDDAGEVPAQDGGYFCMACHDRVGMATKGTCFDCHYHGDKF